MLSEEEKRELRALARSGQVRDEFEFIRSASQRKPSERSIDAYISFLTCMGRLPAVQPPPRPFPIYTNVRL